MLNWSTGLRVDYSTVLSSGSNHEVAIEYDLAWQASEFSRFTLGYYHYLSSSKIEAEGKSSQILLQTVYILGAHPAHEFRSYYEDFTNDINATHEFFVSG